MRLFNFFKKESPERRRVHAELEIFIDKCNKIIKDISSLKDSQSLLKNNSNLNNIYSILNQIMLNLDEAHGYFKVDNQSNREFTLNQLREAKSRSEKIEKILNLKIKNLFIREGLLTPEDIQNIKYIRDNLIITISRIMTLKYES